MSSSSDKIRDLSTQVRGALSTLTEKKKQETKAKKKRNPWGWIVGLVLSAVVALGIGMLLRKIKKHGKELAKLRTAAEKQQIQADQLRFHAELADHSDNVTRLQARAEEEQLKVDVLRATIKVQTQVQAQAVEALARLKNWDDLDAHNTQGR